MKESTLPLKIQNVLNSFCQRLAELYKENLISVTLYGSAASGEFVPGHSNLNLLVILNNADLENLKPLTGLLNIWKFRTVHALFFSEAYLKNSSDVFPIELLDMKENYIVLRGKDILKGISVDTKNLKFQCEQELKSKLISLRQQYLKRNKDRIFLKHLLFKSFTSILHILRNAIRLKGKAAPYQKSDILNKVASQFGINKDAWGKILAAKNKEIRLNSAELERLFIGLVKDLEKIVNFVDRF